MKNIDYNLYKTFLAVYETKNLTKASELLFITQPSVSYSLKELENQLGVKLFFRTSKGVEPTEEAEQLYYYISNAFNTIKTGEKVLTEIQNLERGELKIGTPSHIGIFYLAEYIEQFTKKYPGIKIEIISKSTSDMVYLLETRNLDLIIDSLPIESKRFKINILNLEQLNNCFAGTKETVQKYAIKSVKDLSKVPLIIPSETSSVRKKLEKFLEGEDITFQPIIEAWTTEMMLEFVRRNIGIGYFIENVITTQPDKEKFETVKLEIELPKVDISIAYVEEFLTQVSRTFIDFLNETIVKGT